MESIRLRHQIEQLCEKMYDEGANLQEIAPYNMLFVIKKHREETGCSLTEAYRFFKSQNCVP